MTNPSLIVDVQIALENDHDLPDELQLQTWVALALSHAETEQTKETAELTLRFVEPQEIQQLNRDYRGKDKPTNVLSFPFEAIPGIELNLLGDVVICPQIMRQEANEQQKNPAHHYAHLVVHGVLHLLGYDHIDEEEAEHMESLEVEILTKLGIDDPYQDLQ
ncbi:MAG: rRNA maturation RNase YbeY [Aestuariibacter sp.]